MSNLLGSTLVLVLCLFAAKTQAQEPTSPLDEYFDSANTIVVAKCISVGPVNILLRANVEIDILYVVKGKETLRRITVDSQFGMIPGRFYLLRSEHGASDGERYFRINTRHSVIPIISASEVEQLKTLSPRIIVLRTMNLRVDELESEIRTLAYELEELKKTRKEN